MLARVWSGSIALLARMEIDIATMENGMVP